MRRGLSYSTREGSVHCPQAQKKKAVEKAAVPDDSQKHPVPEPAIVPGLDEGTRKLNFSFSVSTMIARIVSGFFITSGFTYPGEF